MNSFPHFRAVLGAALALSTLAAPPAAWAGPDRAAAISADALVEHISILSSEAFGGRRTGEKGNTEAARYIAAQFAEAGLKPIGTARINDPKAKMDGSGYFQPFSFQNGTAFGKDNLLAATISKHARTFRLGTDYEPARFAGTGKASGEVVFVGYGIRSDDGTRDDYVGIDVTGKVVLLLDGTPDDEPFGPFSMAASLRRKAAVAKERGAVAVVAIASEGGRSPRMFGPAGSDEKPVPVVTVKRPIAEAWFKQIGMNLAEVEKASADSPKPFATGFSATVHTSIEQVSATSANIVGYLPGSDPKLKDEVIVLGAHMDHLGMGGQGSLQRGGKPAMHPGADDNASGSAGVIGLAHYYGEASTRPKRSLVFICFSGEEEGLYGSRAYVKAPIIPLDHTAVMLNLDMIGRMSDNKLTIEGTSTSPDWPAYLDKMNERASFRMMLSPGAFGGSDHEPFATNGVPVLFFFTGIHPDYHRPTDTVDKINGIDEQRVVEFVADITDDLANAPTRPTYQQPTRDRGMGGAPRRARVSLGTIPEYGVQVVGVKLSGVRPGSPAEKAGLKAGDIIVAIGSADITNLMDFTAALNRQKPGDAVKIVVKRGSETVTVTATLEGSQGP